MRVDQVLCAAGPVDAVTNQALAYRALFRRWGWSGDDFAPVQAPGLPRGTIRPLDELRPRAEDPLVVHYSGYARRLEAVLAGRLRTLVVSHNVTPPDYFWSSDPAEAVRCRLARTQLTALAHRAAGLAGVSAFNARELTELSGRPAEVIPVLFDRRALGPPAAMNGRVETTTAVAGRGGPTTAVHGRVGPTTAVDGRVGPTTAVDGRVGPTILFVGRLVPHKRQDLVIRAFARLRRTSPLARLVLVGTPLSDGYGEVLAQLAERLAPGGVTFAAGISTDELWARYRSAHAFLCLSEHEGFCIPLLEAFHFGVPVIARRAGAVGEVVDDAGVLLDAGDGTATVAELLRIVAGDPELRAELAARGRRRLEVYDYERTATALDAAVMRLAAA